MRIIVFILLIVASLISFSQQYDFGSWNVITTKLKLSSKWGLFHELQLRSLSFYRHHYYYEAKVGASYSLNKNFSFLLGVGKYMTYSDGGNFEQPVTANESRLWEQVTMNQSLLRVNIEHRYRMEQRWFKNGYRNRFRYRLSSTAPLNHKKIVPETFYVTVFDEIFLNNETPYFERNRFFAGIGYQISKQFSVQPGFLRQYDYKNNTGFGKNYFLLLFSIDIDAEKNSAKNN
ncbi:MAG: DUF2490 domain-containing protein [Bacteroidetes bacterium]|nr:DUF2490 domain-containing protein [Bacteroidota bacterium]MBS1930186.1 DUF2490 domain-containing protein [Bacteroidota bacterium]